MNESGLLELLFPTLTHFLGDKKGDEIYQYLLAVDKIHQSASKKPLDRSLLLCCLLYPILETELCTQYKHITPHIGEIMVLTSSLIHAFVTSSFPHFPKKISSTAGFIMSTQFRLTPISGKRHLRPKLFRMKEFAEAIHFLKLRALVNDQWLETYTAWNNLYKQHVSQGEHKHHPPPSHQRSPKYPHDDIEHEEESDSL
jgi:poly(A) polymerase